MSLARPPLRESDFHKNAKIMRQGNGALKSGSWPEDNLDLIPGAAVLRSSKSTTKSFRSSPLAGPALSVVVADQPSSDSRIASSYITSATPLAEPLHPYPRTRNSQSISRSVFLRRLSQPQPLADNSPSERSLFSTQPAILEPPGSSAALHVISENANVNGQRATFLEREFTPFVSLETSNGSTITHLSEVQSARSGQLRMGERTTMDARMRESASGSHVRSESPTQSGSIITPARSQSIRRPSTPPQPTPATRTPPKDNSWYTEHAYATTPRFSRLGLPADGVVLPLTAKEYKKKNGSVSRQTGATVRSLSQSLSGRSPSGPIEKASPSRQVSQSLSRTRRLVPSILHILLPPIIPPRRSQKPPSDADCVGDLSLVDPTSAQDLLPPAILPSSPTTSEHSTLFRYDSMDPVDISPSSGTASSASSTLADELLPASRDIGKPVNSPLGSEIFGDDDIKLSVPEPFVAAERRKLLMRGIRCLRWTSRARRLATHPSRKID